MHEEIIENMCKCALGNVNRFILGKKTKESKSSLQGRGLPYNKEPFYGQQGFFDFCICKQDVPKRDVLKVRTVNDFEEKKCLVVLVISTEPGAKATTFIKLIMKIQALAKIYKTDVIECNAIQNNVLEKVLKQKPHTKYGDSIFFYMD